MKSLKNMKDLSSVTSFLFSIFIFFVLFVPVLDFLMLLNHISQLFRDLQLPDRDCIHAFTADIDYFFALIALITDDFAFIIDDRRIGRYSRH